jgi:hypothetical protein
MSTWPLQEIHPLTLRLELLLFALVLDLDQRGAVVVNDGERPVLTDQQVAHEDAVPVLETSH